MKLFAQSSYDFVRHFLRAYPGRSALMVLLLVFSGFAEGVGVVALLPLLELATGDTSSAFAEAVEGVLATVGLTPTLPVLLSVIVLSMVFKALALWLAMRQVGFTVAQVTKDLRLDLVRALLDARWGYFQERKVGEFANAISSEAIRASAAYREACVVLGGVIQVAIYLTVAFLIAWQVSLAGLLVGIGFLYVLRRYVRMARAAGEEQTVLSKSLTGRLVDALQGIKGVKAMAREHLFWPLLEKEAEGLNQAQRRQVVASETLNLFQEPMLTLILAVGLYGALTFTGMSFSAVLVLAFVFYRIMTHVNTLQMRYQIMSVGESAFWSMSEARERAEQEREHMEGGRIPEPVTEAIRFESVSFGYDDEPLFTDLSFAIPAGSLVTLIGPSGAGKTTIVDLICGLHRPASGEIFLDQTPMSEIDVREWRRLLGYVPQETLLFNDTILRNVTLGDESISREQARRALEAAGAWEFVARRPRGLDEVVGQAGARLSGGQRQRISIARALVANPTLLILDEVTTALDPATEREICETLLELRGRVTIVAISHQPALHEAADLTFDVHQGRVVGETLISSPAPAPS